MKTKEELNALKEEVEAMGKKHEELAPQEAEQAVGGGRVIPKTIYDGNCGRMCHLDSYDRCYERGSSKHCTGCPYNTSIIFK